MIDRVSSAGISSSLRSTPQDFGKNEAPIDNNKREFQAFEMKKDLADPEMKEKVAEIVSSLNKFLQPSHTSIRFEFHEKLNEYYVTVIDDKTSEVIREIPSKKMLDFYAAMTEYLGLMVDKKI
jgi:flagellar protein FlaG